MTHHDLIKMNAKENHLLSQSLNLRHDTLQLGQDVTQIATGTVVTAFNGRVELSSFW